MAYKSTQSIYRPPKVFNEYNQTPQGNKKKFPRFLKILIVFIILAIGLIVLIYYTSLFNINKIFVENDQNGEIAKLLQSYQGQNLILLDTAKIKKDIKDAFPNLENIKVIKGLPNSLKLSYEEFTPEIVWKTQGKTYLVNQFGEIFREVEGDSTLPIVVDNKDLAVTMKDQVVTTNFINFINQITDKINGQKDYKIIYFEINETVFQINAVTDLGWYIKFDTTRPFVDQIDALNKFLAEKKNEVHEYVDVRVEGKVFYK